MNYTPFKQAIFKEKKEMYVQMIKQPENNPSSRLNTSNCIEKITRISGPAEKLLQWVVIKLAILQVGLF